MTFYQRLLELPKEYFTAGDISIRRIQTEAEVAEAVVYLELSKEQQEMVNPAGFAMGRAYLQPDNHVPHLIYHFEKPIGFMMLDHWARQCSEEVSWSYFVATEHQGHGYGIRAAKLAVSILTSAAPNVPIRLSTEQTNAKAQQLYQRIGFVKTGMLDGDDLVFEYRG